MNIRDEKTREELQKKGEAILESAASLRESIRCQLELVAKLERQGHLYRLDSTPKKSKVPVCTPLGVACAGPGAK